MRVQHIQQAVRGIYALDPQHRAGLDMVEWRIGRLRHLIWNDYHEEAHDELFGMRHMASEIAYLNGEKFRACGCKASMELRRPASLPGEQRRLADRLR